MNNTLELELQQLDFTLTNVSTTVENLKGFQNILEKHGMGEVISDVVGTQLDAFMPAGVVFKDATIHQAQESVSSALAKGIKAIWTVIKKIWAQIKAWVGKIFKSETSKDKSLDRQITNAVKLG